jgi:NAD(P)-dependent dehydrogenase (short-subunit alcohol dehydrogenase family)
MVEQGGGGSIVNTAALVGLVGNSTQPAYTAAKHAVIGLTRVAAANGGPHGIRVNAVCPGMIATPALQTLLDEETKARLTAAIPLGRPGTVAELAASVAWLLSDDAASITGTHLVVDGGFLACAM